MNDCKSMNITNLNSMFHNHRDSLSLAINSLCLKHSLESEIRHNLAKYTIYIKALCLLASFHVILSTNSCL